ncbi:cytidylyltransferase [Colletotrichum karsti]|uniref:Cytidylyltransferase n=1 Tax=Colletotrichum karsti TaxID=1095194 RepID=A0A9P6LIF4_9PEZI|nr:cytidylyltransferase [Colletotrichum karsti]KAF9874543.1 cytidylyltransferase [Colletotrichum karsti]
MSQQETMSRKALTAFFSRSLASFQTSNVPLRILCTLPHRNDTTTHPAPRSPPPSLKRLVVLDSSFNPPTRAHLRMAASAVRAAAGDDDDEGARLLLLLAVNNADKKPKPVAFPTRLGLMCAFAEDLLEDVGGAGVEVDLGLTTMPFFHDKARAVAEAGVYPREVEQVYLAGFDTLIRIFNPKYYGEASDEGERPIRRALDPFLGRSRLRVTMRVDDEWGGEKEQVGYLEKLRDGGLEEVGGRREWGERVEMVSGEGEVVVSSTKVREAARTGDGVVLEGLLGRRVREWVLEEGLYREDE